MSDITFDLDRRQCLGTGVACINTEMLTASQRRVRPTHHDLAQYRFQLRHVVPVRAGDDERQRGATFIMAQSMLCQRLAKHSRQLYCYPKCARLYARSRSSRFSGFCPESSC